MAQAIDEAVLDDQAKLSAGDPSGMLRAVATAGAQVREAVLRVDDADLGGVVADGRPRAMLVAGMGGSGISGDVLAAVGGLACPVPLLAHRGYRLPGWVGPMDLVVAVSCSGRTEETLAVTDEALRRGCRIITVGQPDSPLAERAVGGRTLHLPVDPAGRMPRSNIWALSVPVLLVADALGLLSVPRVVLDEVADALDATSAACGPAVEAYVNPAKRLALDLAGTLPYIWGSSEIAGVAAYRLACQLAENAKYPAVSGEMPEVHHNQVVALAGAFGSGAADPDDLFRDRVEDAPGWPALRLLLLGDSLEQPELTRRREATLALAEQYGIGVQQLVASGEHALARLASLVAPTDFASVYLALAQGIDPTPIEPIVFVKERTGS
jgi:glucose/mannose-6-phosphate isomerase